MSVTTSKETPQGRFGRRKGEAAETHAPGDGLTPPPKLRRRPVLVVASIAVVCLGALLGVFAWSSVSDGHPVVAARSTIARGQVITRDQLIVVRVGVDPALTPVPAEQIDSLVGKRAALDVAAGSLLTTAAVTDKALPGAGVSVVGVAVGPGGMPGTALMSEDRVRVVLTPGAQGTVSSGEQKTLSATVVSGDRGYGVFLGPGRSASGGRRAALRRMLTRARWRSHRHRKSSCFHGVFAAAGVGGGWAV